MPVFTSVVAAATAAGIGGTMAAGLGAAALAGTIGAGVYAVNKMTQQPKSQSAAPAALPAPPSVDSATVAAQESIEKKRRAVARNNTIFISPFGLSNEEKSGTATKTLLGE